MEWMDRYRLIGGWIWVGIGLGATLAGWLAGAAMPGAITGLVMLAVVVLAGVLVAGRDGRLAVVTGWLVAVLFAVVLGGAVLDRFGVFGEPGAPGVSWGSWDRFVDYTAVLVPVGGLATAAAVLATVAEAVLAVLLLSGWQRRWVGKATAGLLLAYLLAMALSPARTEIVQYGVPVLIGGALLLSATPTRVASGPGREDGSSAASSAAARSPRRPATRLHR
ncbi:hypothetical protein EK0264_10580 [Epidermidibacterium keratini]|uniref:Uncharacterized protein n=1 Tax=Epidermidibacterium keratini TaxID=1891644 RepID=A0A7L4YN27_9ACTN|nr:hypothetical protein [Epidermidibacterium keratini]QHC00691.1 hypothetical protein EK0264_10580 [Epidermidibacterium keratini]